MRQRSALLSIYRSLGADEEDLDRRDRLYGRLQRDEFNPLIVTEDEQIDDPKAVVIRQEAIPKRAISRDAPPLPIKRAAVTLVDEEDEFPVPEAELLEALVAMANRHTFDNRSSFVDDEDLQKMARPLVADETRVGELLEVVFDASRTNEVKSVQPRLITKSDEDPFASFDFEAKETVLDYVRARLSGDGNLDLLSIALQSQPGARCVARLVPVEFEDEGEIAIAFRTKVAFEIPEPRSVQQFVHDLFDPTLWAKRHSFWCNMKEKVGDELPPEARALMSSMKAARAQGQAAGVAYRPLRVFLEAVGNCQLDEGSWPNTMLVFSPSERRISENEVHHYLEYRLVPKQSPYMAFDDGTIQLVQKGRDIEATITKLLYFRNTPTSTTAEVLAEYACVSGWAENTREFLVSWLRDQDGN